MLCGFKLRYLHSLNFVCVIIGENETKGDMSVVYCRPTVLLATCLIIETSCLAHMPLVYAHELLGQYDVSIFLNGIHFYFLESCVFS